AIFLTSRHSCSRFGETLPSKPARGDSGSGVPADSAGNAVSDPRRLQVGGRLRQPHVLRMDALTGRGVIMADSPVETPHHPAALDPELLASQCAFRATRRSGPGGQNRNKVETAVILTHRPTGIRAEASERRTQGENRRAALGR